MENSIHANKKFGEIVKSKRKRKGISQEELAKRLRVSVVYIRDIEYGNYCITWQLWLCICDMLDIDVNKLKDLLFKHMEERKE